MNMEHTLSVNVRYSIKDFATHTRLFYDASEYSNQEKFNQFLEAIKSLYLFVDGHAEIEITEHHDDSSDDIKTFVFVDDDMIVNQMCFSLNKVMTSDEILNDVNQKKCSSKEDVIQAIMSIIASKRKFQLRLVK
jgi:hypothetical protein